MLDVPWFENCFGLKCSEFRLFFSYKVCDIKAYPINCAAKDGFAEILSSFIIAGEPFFSELISKELLTINN